jgi:hypothetical protein
MHYCKECHSDKIKRYRRQSEKHQQYQKEYQKGDTYKATVKRCRQTEDAKKRHRERMRQYRIELKEEVFRHYGCGELKCARCGFEDVRALSMDHIDGSGSEHRKQLKSPNKFYPWLKKNGYPDGFQVLCMNCQFIKKAENNEFTKRIE